MPHTHDAARLRACSKLLSIPLRAMPRTSSGLPHVDTTDPAQQRFQALLVSCLMSTQDQRHPLEHPSKPAFASIGCYLNWIAVRPDRLEIHTNTACRVASRMLPQLHNGTRVSGIPGLRIIDFNGVRLQLQHLPTGARLDLVDSKEDGTRRDMKHLLGQETSWHVRKGAEPLWSQTGVTTEETAHAHHWAARACTPLRSALMMRSIPLWYDLDISPAWADPLTGHPHPRLGWSGDADAQDMADLLTKTEVRIPGAAYQARDRSRGVLTLGNGGVVLVSQPRPPRRTKSLR